MSRRHVALLYILSQALVLSRASGELILPMLLGLFAALLLLPSRPLELSRGVTLFGATVLAVGIAIKFVLAPPKVDPGVHAWPQLVAELLLAGQALLLRRHTLPHGVIAMGLLLVCLLSGRDLQSRHEFSVGAALVFTACGLLYADAAAGVRDGRPTTRRRRGWTTITILLLTMLGAAGLAQHLSQQLPYARRWVATRLSIPVARARNRTVGFSGSGFIGSIVAKKKSNPTYVAMRVYADRTPGYLRGRVFVFFDGRRWQPPQRRTRLEPQGSPPADAPPADNPLFPIGEGRGPWRSMRIEMERGLAGFVFLPLETRYLELPGDSVFVGADSVVLDSAGSLAYKAHVGLRRVATPRPERPRLLQLPSGLHPQVGRLARNVAGGARTSAEKIEAISSYLRSSHKYSLEGFTPALSANPVSQFLLNREPGHCEYFATGTAMLLRHVGVRSRYVTGFLATELEDEYGDFYVARNRDAHAWVEAYDEEREQWVIVDSTPGIDFEEDDAESDEARRMTATAGAGTTSGPWLYELRSLATSPLGMLGVVSLGLLTRFWLRLRRLRQLDPALAMRHWLDRRLRRRGLIRGASETLHQFAARIQQQSAADPWLLQAAAWQHQYAEVRYAGRPPETLPDPRTWR